MGLGEQARPAGGSPHSPGPGRGLGDSASQSAKARQDYAPTTPGSGCSSQQSQVAVVDPFGQVVLRSDTPSKGSDGALSA